MRKIITVLMLLCWLTGWVKGQTTQGNFTVTGDPENYSFEGNKLTITGGEVTVSTTQETTQTILLQSGKLILNGVNISTTKAPPIEVKRTAEIEVAENTKNTLASNRTSYAGIHVPKGSKVTFTGNGTLDAKNTKENIYSSCGIGGQQNSSSFSCGTIIFNMGKGSINATGGTLAAGIGTCMAQSTSASVSGTIHIIKGKITATGGMYAAGIGAGPDGVSDSNKKVSILIEGGTITSKGGDGCSDFSIGNGLNSKATVQVAITGGTINIPVGKSGNLLDQVIIGPDVTIETGEVKEEDYTNGFVFSGTPKTATVKGNAVIPEGATITIDNANGETLEVPKGTTLTNNGTLIFNGTLPEGWSRLTYNNIDETGESSSNCYLTGTDIYLLTLTREGYVLKWEKGGVKYNPKDKYTLTNGDNTFTTSWAKNVVINKEKETKITGKVGEEFTAIDLSEYIEDPTEVGACTYKCTALPGEFCLIGNEFKLIDRKTSPTKAIANHHRPRKRSKRGTI